MRDALILLLKQLHAIHRHGSRTDTKLLALLWVGYEPHSDSGMVARLECYGKAEPGVKAAMRRLRRESLVHAIPAPFGKQNVWLPTEDGQRIIEQTIKP